MYCLATKSGGESSVVLLSCRHDGKVVVCLIRAPQAGLPKKTPRAGAPKKAHQWHVLVLQESQLLEETTQLRGDLQ